VVKGRPKNSETPPAHDDDGGRPREHMILRYFNVFNAEQADGLGLEPIWEERHQHDPIAECDHAIAGYLATGPTLQHGGNQASYSPRVDRIQMPDRNAFATVEEYYSTLFHEITHSTGHPTRLAREEITEGHRFGDACYAREELIAEMGAAMCCGMLGIDHVTLRASAAYLAGWTATLRGDTTMVVKAAAAAQRGADMILGTEPQDTTAQTAVGSVRPKG
jgi:antirestriction protein ArdC